MIRVDGVTKNWMGRPASIPKAVQRSVAITPTKSVFSIIVDDKVRVDVTFLDPITPKDLKRQSLVFSYLDVNVTSWDGKDHEVQIYTDITAGMFACVRIMTSALMRQQNGSRVTSRLKWSGSMAVPLTASITT